MLQTLHGHPGRNREAKRMRAWNNGLLMVITLIGVMTFAGCAQASTTITGDFVDPPADVVGEIVMLWLDVDPSDYATKFVQDGDYYWFDDINPMLNRNGYQSGDTDISFTVAMYCSGTERDIDGVPGNPYTNQYRNVTVLHLTVDYKDCILLAPLMGLTVCAAEETFSKTLYAGWNLISLPLTPSDNSASAVFSGTSYDAVYNYNATSKQFESADVMNPGTGYFVHTTDDCTWEYSGTAYTSTDTSLEPGLNMVGWLNCLKDVGDALSSVSGDYYYIARWNTSAEKFEVYNPAAPSAFNDFTTMDQGTGYFISAKPDCGALSESC